MIFNIKYYIIFQLLFCGMGEVFSQITKQQNLNTWTIYESPVKNKLNRIVMLSKTQGYIAGKYLLKLNNGKWIISSKSPPVPTIECFFLLDKNNIWAAHSNLTNSSDFYHYNGTGWKAEYNPLANQISSIFFLNKKTGWLAGDREIAFLKNGQWKFLKYPNTSAGISYICGTDKNNLWILTGDQKLFSFVNGNWMQQFIKEKIIYMNFFDRDSGFVITGNKLFIRNHSGWQLHSSNSLFGSISRLFFLNNGEIWGAGLNGLIIHFNRKHWEKVDSPTGENLHDIFMTSNNEGWIVGSKGTILKYSFKKENFKNINLGFDLINMSPYSKDVNDEYGVAIEDFNNDNIKDIYAVCIFEPSRLYLGSNFNNSQEISFENEAVYRGATGMTEDSSINAPNEIFLGVGVADIDNDGDEDIYLCNLVGKNKLLLNNGSGYFRNVTNKKGRACTERERTNMAVFGDVDNDGNVDLFITNEYSSNRLFRNNGNGYFVDITGPAGLTTKYGGMCASFADIDGDGRLDLFVSNWGLPNILYRNVSHNGIIKFKNITNASNTGGEPFAKSNGVAFADINNDGNLDLFVANRGTSNRLYLNNGTGVFKDVTKKYLGFDSLLTYGVTFADFDQDGFLDLYISNVGKNILYKNIDGKKFVRITNQTGARHSGYGTGTAAGDIDGDGDIDLYSANYINGPSNLFINTLNNKNYLLLKLKGTISNRDAIGAKVWLYRSGYAGIKSGLLGYREVNGGSGYTSHNSTEIHFGADKNSLYDLVILFPASNIKKILKNVMPGQKIFISEEDGLAAFKTVSIKYIERTAIDPEIQFEAGKLAFVLFLVVSSFFYGKKRYGWNNNFSLAVHCSALAVYIFQILIFNFKGILLSTILPVSSIFIYFVILYLFYERVVLVGLAKREKHATRDRIARDLHDDLASTISSSVIYIQALKRKMQNLPDEDAFLVNKVNSLLADATESITDIVWTISPEHDKLSDLIVRLRILISDICSVNSINFNCQINLNNSDYTIRDETRREIYLIFKEALNNIIHHSRANRVELKAEISNGHFEIRLADNGIGFNTETILSPDESAGNELHGHGIKNILHRARKAGCELSINSRYGKGTEISVRRKLT